MSNRGKWSGRKVTRARAAVARTLQAIRAAKLGGQLNVDNALFRLERDGFVSVTQSGASKVHQLLKLYDRAGVPDRADTVPGTPDNDRAGVPRPIGSGTASVPGTHNNQPGGVGTVAAAALVQLQQELTTRSEQ